MTPAVKKVLLVLVVIYLVFRLVTDPVGSAESVKVVFGAFESLGVFFEALAT